MNKFIKLIAIAMIAVFAAVSCAPDTSFTGFNWEKANAAKAAENGNSTDTFRPTIDVGSAFSPAIALEKNPKLAISFPREADFFRAAAKEEIETGLKSFMTIHSFTKAAIPNVGVEDTLNTTEIAYNVFSISEASTRRIVTIEIERDFTTGLVGAYSNLVFKFDGQKYTFAGGLKLDMDGNEVSGEEFYDDDYIEVFFDGASITGFTGKQNMGWRIDIGTVHPISSNVGVDFESGTSTATKNGAFYTVAYLHTDSKATTEQRNTIAEQFAGGFKMQEFNGGVWSDYKTAVYDETNGIHVKDVSFKHGSAYRVYWSGAANLATTAKYYGVEQRIRVEGGTPHVSSLREKYTRTFAFTHAVVANNNGIRRSPLAYPQVSVFQADMTGRNAIIKLTFPLQYRGLSVPAGIEQPALSAFQGKDAVLKLVRFHNSLGYEDYLNDNYSVIEIRDIEYKAEYNAVLATEAEKACIDTIYITIDPKVNWNTISAVLINNQLKYTGSAAPEIVFGDITDILFSGYSVIGARGSSNGRLLGIYGITCDECGKKGDHQCVVCNDGSYICQLGHPNHCPGCHLDENHYCDICDDGSYFCVPGHPYHDAWRPIELTSAQVASGEWVELNITSGLPGRKILFDVVAGNQYAISWDDSYQGSGEYTALDVSPVRVVHSVDGAFTLADTDSAYFVPHIFTAYSNGTVTIEAEPYGGSSGTFAVKVMDISNVIIFTAYAAEGEFTSPGQVLTFAIPASGTAFSLNCDTTTGSFDLNDTINVTGVRYYNTGGGIVTSGNNPISDTAKVTITPALNGYIIFEVNATNNSSTGKFELIITTP